MNYLEMEQIRQQRGLPELPADLPEPQYPYTVFCQETGGNGTIHITSVMAEDVISAIAAGKLECINDWSAGFEPGDSPWTETTIHCLGVAAGNINILHWEDQEQ